MNQRDVCEAFLRGEEAAAGPLWSKPRGRGVVVLRSYGTPIALSAGRWTYLTESKHTATTARHVALARAALERAHASVIVGDRRLAAALRRVDVDPGRLA